MKVLKTLAGLACGLAVAGPAFAADPVKIGLILPMSGPFAAYGKQIEHGVKLYLAQHGDTYGGRKVELILKDDNPGTSGDIDKRLAQELVVKDKVDILAGFGLENRADHRPDQLSGGQRQRVAIARATIMQPALILADEPTGNLDRHTGEEVVSLLEGLNAGGVTLIVVTHDQAMGARARRQIVMEDGRVDRDSAHAPG